MKDCIKQANKKIVEDAKNLLTFNNMFVFGAILFFATEVVLIIEYLNATYPNPNVFIGLPVALLVILFIGVQVIYTYYIFEECNNKDKP